MELVEFLRKYASCPIELNPEIKTIKDSTVYISGFNKSLLNLHKSNKIILLARSKELTSLEHLLLPITDTIIVSTIYEAFQLSWQLKCKKFNNKVVTVPPLAKKFAISNSDAYYEKLSDWHKKALNGLPLQNVDPTAGVYINLGEESTLPKQMIASMLSGAIPIVLDLPLYAEFITNGHNGYLIRSSNDIVEALEGLTNRKEWLSYNAKTTVEALLNPTRYLNAILHPENLTNINFFEKATLSLNSRIWLVREHSFNQGYSTYFPSSYRKDLTVIDLNSLIEVLNYFSAQEFNEVYVFGIDLPSELSSKDEIDLQRQLIKLGNRSLKIHFCRNDPIPASYHKIFSKLSILSIEEGLKQVSD